MGGTILTANSNFLEAIGYTLEEVKGRHHSMFVDPAYRQSQEYKQFWLKLGRGEYQSGEFKRIAKGGREIWLQATYNPILDVNKKPVKIVKYAADTSVQVNLRLDIQNVLREVTMNATGLDPSGMQYSPGGSGTRNMVRAYYKWQVITDLVRPYITPYTTTTGARLNEYLIVATAAFQNEQYP